MPLSVTLKLLERNAQSLNAEEENNFMAMWTAWNFHTRILNKTIFWLLAQRFGLRGSNNMIRKWRQRITMVLNLSLSVKDLPERKDKD